MRSPSPVARRSGRPAAGDEPAGRPGDGCPRQLFASGSRSLASTRGAIAAPSRQVNRIPYRRSETFLDQLRSTFAPSCTVALKFRIYLIVKFPEAQQLPDKSRLSLSLGNKTVALPIGNHINYFQIVLIIISPVKRKISQSCHLAYMLIKFFTSFVIKQCFL